MWIVLAISAAILWGMNYSIAEKVLASISPITLLALEMALGALVFLTIGYFTSFKQDIHTLANHPSILWLTLANVVTLIAASFFINTSILYKNGTVAGIIEIIYPIFIILFTWLFFNENHVNTGVIIGGIFIFIGVIIVSLS